MAHHTVARPLDVVVGGGSLAGLSAALLLHRAGHNVHLHERSPTEDRSHRGAGIVLQRHVLDLFRNVGLAPPDAMSVRCERRQYLDKDGHVTRTEDYSQRMTSWSVLYKALKDTFPAERYHTSSRVSNVVEEQSRVVVHLADKASSVACDMFVAADGPRSTVRQQLLPQVERRYAGYVAWRGVVPERSLPSAVSSTLVDRFTFFHGPATQILSYLIPGPGGSLKPGERDLNWVWYWNYSDTALASLLTDVSGHRHSDALSAEQVRPQEWEEQQRRARAHLPPQFATLVQMTDAPLVQAITDLAVTRMAHGRIALVGEAAFIPRPHTAASTDQAFSNALGLSKAVLATESSGVADALRCWEAEQREYGEYLQNLGQTLGQRSQFGDPNNTLDVSKLRKSKEAG